MTGLLRRSLTVRVYLFALACFALVVISIIALFIATRTESIRGRMVHLSRGLSLIMAERPTERDNLQTALAELDQSGMDMTMVAADGAVIAAAGAGLPAVDRATVARARALGSFELDKHVVITGLPDGTPSGAAAVIARFAPPRPPASYFAAILAALLAAMLAISIAFTRSLTRPLSRLSATARRFGSGDLEARTGMTRADQLGDVSQAFDEMAERITSLIEANQALMGAVSHELRTPMARIRVTLDLVAEDPDAVHELLDGVSSDLTELERLVDDILTMTRLQGASGMPPLHVESLAPADLAERARDGWHRRHGQRALTLAIEDELPALTGDAVLLRRALDNLLDNAAKYAPADTAITLRVRLSQSDIGSVMESDKKSGNESADESDRDRAICFSVIDRGPGMSADEMAHAFTPFWRSDDSRARKTGGVGLGLPLARQLALAHGGDIELSSPGQGGLCATLRIPTRIPQRQIPQKQTETRANN